MAIGKALFFLILGAVILGGALIAGLVVLIVLLTRKKPAAEAVCLCGQKNDPAARFCRRCGRPLGR